MTSQSVPPSSASSSGGAAMFFFCGIAIGAAVVGFTLASRSASNSPTDEVAMLAEVPASVKSLHASNAPGLHNVFRLGDQIYSGSAPDEEHSFASLERLGVKVIISVDGATPDVESAHRYGMKYVHLPITYGGVPHETLVQLMKAVKQSGGPVYVHCHHGKHRGPAAAVSMMRCLDKKVTPGQAYASLKLLGTSDRYQGLYTSVQELKVPTSEEMGAFTQSLPEITPVEPLVKTMAEIDRMWDRVVTVATDSTEVSMQMTTAFDLGEHFREAARLSGVDDAIKPGLNETADALDQFAEALKAHLRKPSPASTNSSGEASNPLKEAITGIQRRCNECHAKHRD